MITAIASFLRKLAQDPNDDPRELYDQIRPLLSKMGLLSMTNYMKLEIVPGVTQGTNSLYKVILRRTATITDDTIDRIKRNEDNFKNMEWEKEALVIYLWWPYKNPASTTP